MILEYTHCGVMELRCLYLAYLLCRLRLCGFCPLPIRISLFIPTLACLWSLQRCCWAAHPRSPFRGHRRAASYVFPDSHTIVYRVAPAGIPSRCPWIAPSTRSSTSHTGWTSRSHCIGSVQGTSSRVCWFRLWRRRGKWMQSLRLRDNDRPILSARRGGSRGWVASSWSVAVESQWRQSGGWCTPGR